MAKLMPLGLPGYNRPFDIREFDMELKERKKQKGKNGAAKKLKPAAPKKLKPAAPKNEELEAPPPTAEKIEPASGVKQLELGERLGSGCSKTCFAVPGDDKYVYLVSGSQTLRDELEMIMQLDELGIPVWKPVTFFQHIHSKEYPSDRGKGAFVMERAGAGSRGDNGPSKLPEIINENSIKSLQDILKALEEACVYINDLQFLVAQDGTVKVSDPGAIRLHNRTDKEKEVYRTGTLPSLREVVKDFSNVVEFCIARRAKLIQRRLTIEDLKYESRQWREKMREIREAKYAANMGIPTMYWREKSIAA